jgi:hypothetical protein
MKKFYGLLAIVLIIATNISLSAEFGFKHDNLYVGPTVGLNQYFSGGALGFGARAEYGLIDNVELGSFKGAIGVGAELFYTSFSEKYYMTYEWKYTYISFLVFGSYHLSPHATWDPYVRFGIGYNSVSFTDSWSGGLNSYSAGYGSGLGTTGDIGIFYHLSDGMAIRASIGYPVLLGAGVDFNLGAMGWSAKK